MLNIGASTALAATGGIDLGTINGSLSHLSQATEDNLNNLLTTIGAKDSPSVTDMLSLQQGLQNWSVTIESSSTVTKDFFDTLKEILQKAG
jgi:type III secretion apparatus needle protein